MRRRKRRYAIMEAVETLTFTGENVKDAFQMAVKTLGARPADRKWAWEQLQKMQREEAAA